MFFRKLLCLSILVFLLLGCQHASKQTPAPQPFSENVSGAIKPWTDKGIQNDADRFQFAIISDLHGSNRPGIFEVAVKKINLMQPDFVMSVGDLIEGYTDEPATVDKQRTGFENMIAPLGMRFFFVPGNHDLTSPFLTKKWESMYGKTYYHFLYKNVLFLCVNTEDPPIHSISEAQVSYFDAVLTEYPDVRWTFVFMHEPLWQSKNTRWDDIQAKLAQRPHTVFAGHDHSYVQYGRNGNDYIKLATTGGGSDLRGACVGEFDQIAWVTMADDKPVIANLSLDGIFDKDLVTEDLSHMIDKLFWGQYLSSDGIVVETRTFKQGTTALNMANSGSAPLKIKGTYRPQPQLQTSVQAFEYVIPPQAEKEIPITISAGKAMALNAMAPVVYDILAEYEFSDRLPVKAETAYSIDMRYAWQGPELITNGHFDDGMNGWTSTTRTPDSGTVSVEDGALKAHVSAADFPYALVLVKITQVIKTEPDYQLSFKAKNVNGPNQMRFSVRDGGSNATLLVNGEKESSHVFELSDTMTPYTLNFRFEKQKEILGGLLLWIFSSENEVVVDDISLRTVDTNMMAGK